MSIPVIDFKGFNYVEVTFEKQKPVYLKGRLDDDGFRVFTESIVNSSLTQNQIEIVREELKKRKVIID